jgi:uncharacterized membrane protein
MPFCATCGAPVEGRFCAKCGSAVVSGAPGTGATPEAVPPGSMQPPPAVAAPMSDNIASALCYVLGFITGIIFLVIAPYNQNKTVRFHAFQSIFLSVAAIAIRLCLGFILAAVGTLSFLFLSGLVSLGFFILWLFMIITAYQGKTIVLPVIGPLAQQQA